MADKPPYLTAPQKLSTMPPGIPYIVGNEAAERFNFYGMRAILVVFMTKYLVDRSGALAWFRGLPPSPLRDAMGTNASTFVAAGGEIEAAIELCRPTSAKTDHHATAHLAQIYAERDPAAAGSEGLAAACANSFVPGA